MSEGSAIVVAGFGRCGSSLAMQMLQAGGVPCVGKYPAFEDSQVRHAVTPDFIASIAGRAVKILDPHRTGLPGNVRVIWLDRDADEQARSHAKFAAVLLGAHYDRNQRRALASQLVRDRRDAMRTIAGRPTLVLTFEAMLAQPKAVARRMGEFVGMPFDVDAAARQVRPRTARCASGLDMELLLVGAAP